MPAEQLPSIPQFEVSTITEQDLQKPVAGKMLVKRCMELEAECQQHIIRTDIERKGGEQIARNFHSADSQRQVLEARLEVLNNRDAISQLLFGAMAIVIAMMIDSGRYQQWTNFIFCAAAVILLICAVLVLQGYKKNTRKS